MGSGFPGDAVRMLKLASPRAAVRQLEPSLVAGSGDDERMLRLERA